METNRLVVSPVLFVKGQVSHSQPIMGYLASHFLLTIIFPHIIKNINNDFQFQHLFFLILRELLLRCVEFLKNSVIQNDAELQWSYDLDNVLMTGMSGLFL